MQKDLHLFHLKVLGYKQSCIDLLCMPHLQNKPWFNLKTFICMKEQASIHRLKSTIIPTLQAFLSITDITEVNQSVLYNTIHRELLCNVQKRSMRKICKMHRCWLDSISKTTSANMHSFVLFPPFLIFILIPSLLFWLQLPGPSSLCYRFLRYGGIRFTWWLPYALQHHETRECWPTVQAYHIN